MPEQEAVIYQPSNQDASNNRLILLSSVQPQQKVSQTLELTNRNNITSDKTNANVSWEDDIEDSDPEFFKEMDINYDLVLASKAGKSKTDEIALDKHTNDEIISSVQIGQTLELTNRNNITSDKTNANVSWEDDIEDSDPEFFKEMDINYDLVLASKAESRKLMKLPWTNTPMMKSFLLFKSSLSMMNQHK